MKTEIRMKHWLALLMALLLAIASAVMTSTPAYAIAEETVEPYELADDYTGKTVILQSNDVHGNIVGYANIAGLRDELEKRGAHVIMADSGDYMQGGPYVNFYKGKSAVRMMNKAGYDIATVGNHEFDYTAENMLNVLKDAKFKALSSSSTLTEKCRESHVLDILKQSNDSLLHQADQPPYIIEVPE